MAFPQPNEYNEAIQNLGSTMSDAELRAGEAAVNPLGLPMPSSGNFADVYKVRCPATGNTWAVKCFTREVAGLKERYRGISEHLQKTPFGFMVEFHYVEPGIRIGKQSYPFLKMRWVEGLRLNQFVGDYLDKPKTLKNLLPLWVKLSAKLREAKIAHGDLQHGNVLLVPVPETGQLGLKLIDYDGMYVPALAKTKSGEVGHPCFQHPQRIKEAIYNAEVDRFSHLAIYTAIQASMVGKRELWDKFDNGDNLLFRETDFKHPETSELFRQLWETRSQPELHSLVGRLILACKRPLNQCPHLDELVFNGAVLPLSRELEAKVVAMVGTAASAAPAPQFRQSPGGTLAATQSATRPAATGYPLAPLGLADLLDDVAEPSPAAQTSLLAPRKRSLLKQMGVLPWVAGGVAALGLVVVVTVLAHMGGSARRDTPSPAPAIALSPPTASPVATGSAATGSRPSPPVPVAVAPGSAATGSMPSPPSQTTAISPPGPNNPSPGAPSPPASPDPATSSPPGPNGEPGRKSDAAAAAEPATPGPSQATTPPPNDNPPSPANPTMPGNGGAFSVTGRNFSYRGAHQECRVTLTFVYSGPLGATYSLVVEGRDGTRRTSPFVVNSNSGSYSTIFAGLGMEDAPLNVSIEDASGNRLALVTDRPTVPSPRQHGFAANPRVRGPRMPSVSPAGPQQTPVVVTPSDADEANRRHPREPAPDPSQPDYYEQMAKRMFSDDVFVRGPTLDALLTADPAKAPEAAREQITSNFNELATSSQFHFDHGKGVRGLARWGGKDSVPTLLALLSNNDHFLHDDVYKALGDLKDPRTVAPVAMKLGNFFEGGKARECLRRMGEMAEDAVITIAGSRDASACLAAVELLGEIGTKNSMTILRRGMHSGNPQVRLAAKVSLDQVRGRQSSESSEEDK